ARRDDGRQERRALLKRPELLHRPRVVSRELADVAVGARHLEEAPVGARAPAAGDLLDLLAADLDAALAQRNDQALRRRVMRHRLPVVAAFGRRTSLHPVADFRRDDVGAIARLTGLGIDAIEDVLEHGLLVAEESARLAVELPQD